MLYVVDTQIFVCIFVGYLPNCSLAIEAMLATASIGAIWSSTSPDFGVSVSMFKY